MVSAQLVVIALSLVLLYVLIKAHLYAVRRLWVPKFEEERAEDASDDDEAESEGPPEDRPTGWDHVG